MLMFMYVWAYTQTHVPPWLRPPEMRWTLRESEFLVNRLQKPLNLNLRKFRV